MLKTCPECEQSVSEKAYTCPHCGYPLKSENIKPRRQNKRRKRLPNGFGQITKISGRNLTNPYRAMVNAGKDDNGRPISKLLKPRAYFPTYNDAYNALVEYNKDPFDISTSITMNELFYKWLDEHDVANPRSLRNIKYAWAYCEQIYNVEVQAIRAKHITKLFSQPYKTEDGEKIFATPSTVSKLKSTLNQLCAYAMKCDLMTRNYAKETQISNKHDEKHHKAFTESEMNMLWANSDNKFAAMILIQCYMGWRPSELLTIKRENVNLDEMYVVGGSKTKAGINRIVPIHSRIQPLFMRFWNASAGGEWLFTSQLKSGNRLSYSGYRDDFNAVLDRYGLDHVHLPHDCRKQFVTMAKDAKMDEYALKRIVGHSITDITESTYTDRPVSWLREEIEKIK